MSLTPGTRLGAYEITAKIGEGGMGEVYRATDTNLARQVAIKVLPEAVAHDAERLARFDREAKTLAALNHPNIAQIFGLEKFEGRAALVMELVEGSTLADRISRGPIPVDEALPVARQIAEALEAAHEQGIVHRDLKPANIKVKDDGTVKVLDFGLAKAMEPLGSLSVSMSPTLTTPAQTLQGVVLGTAAYMSPEQARGKAVDRRADLWAFGCVLYEMLTGQSAFRGETVTDVLAAVVKTDPDWTVLPVDVPFSIRRVLVRCLAKNAKARLADASTARLEIDETLHGAGIGSEGQTAVPTRTHSARLPWAVAATMTILAIGAVAVPRWEPASFDAPVPEARIEFFDAAGLNPVVSPDGTAVTYLAGGANERHWVIRTLATGRTTTIPGVAGNTPFWSPDGQSLAFMAGQKLRRMDLATGTVQTLADAPTPRGGSWGRDGTIVFAPGGNGPIFRIPASGGTPEPVTVLQAPQGSHRHPVFLPDGEHFLLWVLGPAEVQGVYLGSLHDSSITRLGEADAPAAFAPPDQVLFFREGVLYSQSLDVSSARMVGDALPIASGFRMNSTNEPRVSASQNGVVAFRADRENRRQIAWVDRSGRPLQEVGPVTSDLGSASLSPDGATVAVGIGGVITLMDVSRGTLTRFTEGTAPVWSPDGSRLAFQSTRDGLVQIYLQRIASSEPAEPLFRSNESQNVHDWSPDGRYIGFSSQSPENARDLWAAPVTGGDRTPIPIAQTPASESGGAFSPDGKWFAYASDENGSPAVFVRAFPGPGRAWRVSPGAGYGPFWRADGKELYYFADGQLMAVPVEAGTDAVDLGTPTPLFPTDGISIISARTDGQRFLVSRLAEDVSDPPLTVIVNWRPSDR